MEEEKMNVSGTEETAAGEVTMDDAKKDSKAMAITAMVFGIVSLVFCCAGFPFAIVGIILSLIVLINKKNGRGQAIAGLITSLISFIIGLIYLINLIPNLSYFDGYMDLGQNMAQYVEEYEEDGLLPPVLEDMINDGKITEEEAEAMMETYAGMFGGMVAEEE